MADLKASLTLQDKFTKQLRAINSGLQRTTQVMKNFQKMGKGAGDGFRPMATQAQDATAKVVVAQTRMAQQVTSTNAQIASSNRTTASQQQATAWQSAQAGARIQASAQQSAQVIASSNNQISSSAKSTASQQTASAQQVSQTVGSANNQMASSAKASATAQVSASQQAVGGIQRMANAARTGATQVGSSMANAAKSMVNWARDAARAFDARKMFSSFVSGFKTVVSNVGSGVSRIIALFGNLGNRIRQTFSNVRSASSGIFDRLRSGAQSSQSSVNGLTGSVKNLASSLLLVKGLGAITNMIGQGMSGAIDRYDTLQRFPTVMTSMGFDDSEVTASRDRLVKGIDRLPTTLDEVVANTQGFATLTGDLSRATELTLALNNGFLASGKSGGDVSRGMQQFSQMLGTGEVDVMSWRTLIETMPVALKEVSENLGYSDYYKLYDALKDGTMTFDDFADGLINVNTESTRMADLARENSRGIRTAWGNITNAFTVGFGGMLEKFDESLEARGLPTIVDVLESTRDKVNSAFTAINDKMPAFIDGVMNVYDVLKNVTKPIRDVGGAIKDTITDFWGDTFGNNEWRSNIPFVGEFMNNFLGDNQVDKKINPITRAWDKLTGKVSDSTKEMSHTVSSGDNLWDLAAKYYGDGSEWTKIYEANKDVIDDAWWIFPDQTFEIPGVDIQFADSSIADLGRNVAGWFDDTLNSWINGEDELVSTANAKPMQDWWSGVVSKIENFNLADALGNFSDDIKSGFADFSESAFGQDIFDNLPQIGKFVGTVAGVASGYKLLTKVAKPLAKIAMAHPMLGLAVGVAGLGAGLLYAWENVDGFAETFDGLYQQAKNTRTFKALEQTLHDVGQAVGRIEWGDIATEPGKVFGQVWDVAKIAGLGIVNTLGALGSDLILGAKNLFNNVDWSSVGAGAYEFVTGLGQTIADNMPSLGASTGALAGSIIVAAGDIMSMFAREILGVEPDEPLTTVMMLDAIWSGTGDLVGWASKALSGFGVAFLQALREEITGQPTPTRESQKKDLADRAEVSRNTPKQSRTGQQNAAIIEQDFTEKARVNVVSPIYDTHSAFEPMLQNPTDNTIGRAVDTGSGDRLNEQDYGTFWGNVWTGLKNTVTGTVKVWSGAGNSLRSFLGQDAKGPIDTAPVTRSQGRRPIDQGHSPGPIQAPVSAPQPYQVPLRPELIVAPVGKGLMSQTEQRISQIVKTGSASLAPVKVDVPTVFQPRSKNAELDIPEPKVGSIKPISMDVPTVFQPRSSNVEVDIPEPKVGSARPISLDVPVSMRPSQGRVTMETPEVSIPNVRPVTVDVPIVMKSSVSGGINIDTPSVVPITRAVSSIDTTPVTRAQSVVTQGTKVIQTDISTMQTGVVSRANIAFTGISASATSGMAGMSSSVTSGSSLSNAVFGSASGNMVATSTASNAMIVAASIMGMMGLNVSTTGGMAIANGTMSAGTSQMVATVSAMSGGMFGAGLNAMAGLTAGIRAGGGAAIAAATAVANAVRSAVQSALRIASPSKALREDGHDAMLGLGLGLTDMEQWIEKQATQAISPLANSGVSLGQSLLVNNLPEFDRPSEGLEISQSDADNYRTTSNITVEVKNRQVAPQIILNVENNNGDLDEEEIVRMLEDRLLELMHADLDE